MRHKKLQLHRQYIYRDDLFLLAGEHRPGAPETGHHLIEDQVNSMPVTPGPDLRQLPHGPGPHFVDPLDQGLQHHRSRNRNFRGGQRAQIRKRAHPCCRKAEAAKTIEKE